MRALGAGAAVAGVAAAFWVGLLLGLDVNATDDVRDVAAAAAWFSGGLAVVLLGGIPYVRISAAREADRIRKGLDGHGDVA